MRCHADHRPDLSEDVEDDPTVTAALPVHLDDEMSVVEGVPHWLLGPASEDDADEPTVTVAFRPEEEDVSDEPTESVPVEVMRAVAAKAEEVEDPETECIDAWQEVRTLAPANDDNAWARRYAEAQTSPKAPPRIVAPLPRAFVSPPRPVPPCTVPPRPRAVAPRRDEERRPPIAVALALGLAVGGMMLTDASARTDGIERAEDIEWAQAAHLATGESVADPRW